MKIVMFTAIVVLAAIAAVGLAMVLVPAAIELHSRRPYDLVEWAGIIAIDALILAMVTVGLCVWLGYIPL